MNDAEYKKAAEIVDKRWEEFLYSNMHGVAYLLDPTYCGAMIDLETLVPIKVYMIGFKPSKTKEMCILN